MLHSLIKSIGADSSCIPSSRQKSDARRAKSASYLHWHHIKLSTVSILMTRIICGGVRTVTSFGAATTRNSAGGRLSRITPLYSPGYRLFYSAIVLVAPVFSSLTRTSSDSSSGSSKSNDDTKMADMFSETNCYEERGECSHVLNRYSFKENHHQDQDLWMYHVESTTSTMDEAKVLVEHNFIDKPSSDKTNIRSFLISATSQSRGRGTTGRNWDSDKTGNALFTLGILQSSWMNDLKSRNDGRMVPLTLLPLKVGSVVASHINKFLENCQPTDQTTPKVTLKWPNDVLLQKIPLNSQSKSSSYEKVAGILIESTHDWFLIGIGINMGYAPFIPSEGVNHGRKAACLSQYCRPLPSLDETDEKFWTDASKNLAQDIAYDIHSWIHPILPFSRSSSRPGEEILIEWKSYVDWDMELILRDSPKRERVVLEQVLEDGRVLVQEVDTGLTRTLVSDYFL